MTQSPLPPSPARRRPIRLAFLLLLLILGYPAVAGAQDAAVEPTPTPLATPLAVEGAPVVVNGQELFRLQTRVGSVTATERAALVSDHIGRLANNPFTGELMVTVLDTDMGTDIVIGDEVLVTVTNTDAAAAGRERAELAQEWATIIQETIVQGQTGVGVPALTAGLGITLAVILLLIVLIWLIRRFGDWLSNRLDPATESPRRLPPALVRSEFYQTGQFSWLVRLVLRLVKIVLGVFAITVAIPLILRAFPQTRELGTGIIRSLLRPLAMLWDGLTGLMPDLIFLSVLAALTWVITRLIYLFFREVARGVVRLPSFEAEWAGFTARMLSVLVIIIALIVGFTSLPFSQLPVFQGISAFIALLLTLASSSAISNIIAGIILTYTGAFRLGDIIALQSTTGEVVGRYLLTTRVQTFKNELVSLPNSLVLSNSVTNYSRLAREHGLTLYTQVTIGYDVPWQQVHDLLLAAAAATARVLKSPAPYVLQKALNDFSVTYELNIYTRQPQYLPRIYSELHQQIQDHFNAAGVEIMSPVYTALRDGNALTLPPAFRAAAADGNSPPDGPNDAPQPPAGVPSP